MPRQFNYRVRFAGNAIEQDGHKGNWADLYLGKEVPASLFVNSAAAKVKRRKHSVPMKADRETKSLLSSIFFSFAKSRTFRFHTSACVNNTPALGHQTVTIYL